MVHLYVLLYKERPIGAYTTFSAAKLQKRQYIANASLSASDYYQHILIMRASIDDLAADDAVPKKVIVRDGGANIFSNLTESGHLLKVNDE